LLLRKDRRGDATPQRFRISRVAQSLPHDQTAPLCASRGQKEPDTQAILPDRLATRLKTRATPAQTRVTRSRLAVSWSRARSRSCRRITLRLSGSPTQLAKEARYRGVRFKRLLNCAVRDGCDCTQQQTHW